MIAQRATRRAGACGREAKRTRRPRRWTAWRQTRAGFAKEHEAILDCRTAEAEQADTATRDGAAKTEAAAHTAAAELPRGGRTLPTRRPGPTARASSPWRSPGGWLPGLHGPAVQQRVPRLAGVEHPGDACYQPRARRAQAEDGGFEAVSAEPLDPASRSTRPSLIGEPSSAEPKIAFETDPALIAGLELHGPHRPGSNSWRADLDSILLELRMTPPGRPSRRAGESWLQTARASARRRSVLGPRAEQIGRVEEVGDGIALVSGLPESGWTRLAGSPGPVRLRPGAGTRSRRLRAAGRRRWRGGRRRCARHRGRGARARRPRPARPRGGPAGPAARRQGRRSLGIAWSRSSVRPRRSSTATWWCNRCRPASSSSTRCSPSAAASGS